MQPAEQSVEGGKAGLASEEPIEAGAQLGLASGCRIAAIGFEVGVEPPDETAGALLGSMMSVGEASSLWTSRSMDPTQPMPADIELAGIAGNDHHLGEQAVGMDAAPQRPFGGDPHRIGQGRKGGNAEPPQMSLPRRPIGELFVVMLG